MIPIKYLIYSRSQASDVILRGAAPPPARWLSFFFFAFAQRKKNPLDDARFNTEAPLPPHLEHTR